MALDNVLKIYDEQGNPVDYDILASDVKFNDGKDLPTKLTELEGEIGEGGYAPPAGGIPKTDLSSDVQTSLGKADTAYQKPASGIPATDLADGVIPDVSGLATKTELQQGLADKVDKVTGKGLSTNDYTDADKVAVGTIGSKANAADVYTKAQTDAAIQEAVEDLPTGDIPTKVSELENDEGFVTADALVGLVAGSADFVMTEDTNAFYITRVVPVLNVTELAAMSENTKSGTFKVSGTNLKGNVVISTSASGWSLSANGGTAAQSITLQPTDGTLAETTINVAYSGTSDSVGNAITIASTGAESKSVTANYTVFAGPTITTSGNGISVSAIAGNTNTATVQVQGVMLTNNITAALSGTNAGKFSLSKSTFTQVDGSINETLTITYSPSANDSGTHSATLTLSSTGATSVSIALTGNVLTQSLSLSPKTLDLSSATGVSASGTIKVIGENLTSDVTLSVGTGFSVSPATIAAATINAAGSTGVDVTVTADTTTASGTLTATSGSFTDTASLAWSVQEADPSANDIITKNGIYYKVLSAYDSTNGYGTLRLIHSSGEDKTGYAKSSYSMSSINIDTIMYAGKEFRVTEVGVSAFADCSALKTVVLGSSVERLKSMSFYGCGITSLTIDEGLKEIGTKVFQSCSSLSSVSLPNSLVSIADYAFVETRLNSITIPDNVTWIGNQVFSNPLKTVYIGRTDALKLSSMAFPFFGVTSITDIYLRWNGQNIVNVTNDQCFDATVEANSILHVPTNATGAYNSNTNYWKQWYDENNNRIVYDLTPTE